MRSKSVRIYPLKLFSHLSTRPSCELMFNYEDPLRLGKRHATIIAADKALLALDGIRDTTVGDCESSRHTSGTNSWKHEKFQHVVTDYQTLSYCDARLLYHPVFSKLRHCDTIPKYLLVSPTSSHEARGLNFAGCLCLLT